jgi:uncharacterized protein
MAARIKLADEPKRYYGGADVPMRAIRKFAREVAERYKPDKIVLFGSYAYGTPNAGSDVDILVVMPCRNQHDQSVRIRFEIPRSFAMDLLVRTPTNLAWRLEEGESFHSEILTRGVVLYEAKRTRMGPIRGSRLAGSSASRKRPKRA